MTPMRRLRAVIAAACLVVPVAGASTAAATAGAVRPALNTLPDMWGYVVGRHPTTGSYLPGASSSRDDMATTVGIQRLSTGAYQVQFPNDYPSGPNVGTVLVTALSATRAFCTVMDLGQQSMVEQVIVACQNRLGFPADTKFSMNFIADHSFSGRVAYVNANQPSASDYTPDANYAFNSKQHANTVHRVGTGIYNVRLGGMASTKGNVQVSSFGVNLCRVPSWGPSGIDALVKVTCRDTAGHFADTDFNLVFTQGQGLKKHGATGMAYLMADRPSAATYTPIAQYRWSSNNQVPTVRRSAVGHYVVTLTGYGPGGSAEVTPYGNGATRCVLSFIATTGPVAKVGVICTKPNGAAVDSKFGLSFTR